MNNVASQPASSEGRQQPRTHLFVLATLYADDSSSPVHIRNMSPSGALIEAFPPPDVGCRILLRRGRLLAKGFIAWQAGRRAGVRFEAQIYVPDWASRQVSVGQEDVDELLASLRLNGEAGLGRNADPASLESELLQLRSDLAEMGCALVADIIVAATHPEIQAIDISLQRIDRMLERLQATQGVSPG